MNHSNLNSKLGGLVLIGTVLLCSQCSFRPKAPETGDTATKNSEETVSENSPVTDEGTVETPVAVAPEPITENPESTSMLPTDIKTLMARYQTSVNLTKVTITKLDLPQWQLSTPGLELQFEFMGEDASKNEYVVHRRKTSAIRVMGPGDVLHPGVADLDFYLDSVANDILYVFVSADALGYIRTENLFTTRVSLNITGEGWEMDPTTETFYRVHREIVSSIDRTMQFELELTVRLREAEVPKSRGKGEFVPKSEDTVQASKFPKPESNWLPKTTGPVQEQK